VRGVKARTAGSRTLSKLVFAWNSRHLACHAFYGRPLKATPLRSGTRQLAHDQHFTNAIAGEKELYGSKVTKQIFDVAIIEDALQLKSVGQGGMDSSGRAAASFAAEFDLLHFESVAASGHTFAPAGVSKLKIVIAQPPFLRGAERGVSNRE